MDVLLWIAAIAVVAGVIMVALLLRPGQAKKSDNTEPPEDGENVADRQATAGVRRRANRGLRAQLQASRRARLARDADEDEDDGHDESGDEDEIGLDDVTALTIGKIGTKKMRRLQAKADKKAQREQEEAVREDRKRREAEREEKRKLQEEKQRKQEELEAEEAKQLKEEQEKKELEEYLKLKESFIVEEEGVSAETEEESQALLQQFVQHIKDAKVIQLEELAAEFNLRTPDAINRIQSLQESGDLTGVIDDRGKFIYISPEELNSIAQFIKQRGRVSITELASSSNSLVNLRTETVEA